MKRIKMSYKHTLNMIMITFIVVPLVFMIVFFSCSLYKHRVESSDTRLNLEFKTSCKQADQIFNNIYLQMKFILNNIDMNSYLNSTSEISIESAVELNKNISNIIAALLNEGDNGRIIIYSTNPYIYSLPAIQKIDSDNSEYLNLFSESDLQYYINTEKDGYEDYFCIYFKYSTNVKYSNILSYKIPLKNISSHFENLFTSAKTINISGNDLYVDLFKDITINQNNGKIRTYETNCFDIRINFEEKSDLYRNEKIKLLLILSVGDILLIILVIFLVKWLIRFLFFGIKLIIDSMNSSSFENTEIIKNYGEEFDAIYKYLVKITSDLEKEKEQRLNLELNMHIQKMSPHFLYNSLSALYILSDNPTVKKGIDCLLQYYRKVFYKNKFFVSIYDELESLKIYVEILKISYDADFQVIYNIEDEILDYMIPIGIIQPLIENAFIHGINPSDDGGVVNLSVKCSDEKINISVINDGYIVNSQLIMEKFENGSGMLNIIHKILRFYYKDKFSYNVENTDNHLVVSLEFPI